MTSANKCQLVPDLPNTRFAQNGGTHGDADDTPIPDDAVSLESILCTEELYDRPSRPPDYERENRALVTLAHVLADSPRNIFQTLADTILNVSQADSAGLSLLTQEDGGKRFYWPAIAGTWKPHIGGGTPRNFGPCGDVLDRNTPLLFRHVERRYTYFQPVTPPVEECLLVPFYVEGKAVGTVWAVAHDDRRKFDLEDERLLTSLANFASSAFQTIASLNALEFQVAERQSAETKLRALADTLEEQVRMRTAEVLRQNSEALKQSERLRTVSYRLMQAQDMERRRIARELHDSSGQILAALSMNLATIGLHAKQNLPHVADTAEDGQRLVQQLSQEIRTMSYLLHPPLLEETGLAEALRWYIQGLGQRSGLEISLSISEDFGRLSPEMELVIFRIVQESLTNVHRHSGSKNAVIRMVREGEKVLLQVRDEGKGIPAEKLSEIQSQGSGVGMCGMRERVRQFEGDLTIQSDASGTTISFAFLVPKVANKISEINSAGAARWMTPSA